MLAKAKIEFIYRDEETAQKMAYLLELDNKIAPRSLKLKTIQLKNNVTTSLEHENLGTFFAALDDLVFSEKLISDLLEGLK